MEQKENNIKIIWQPNEGIFGIGFVTDNFRIIDKLKKINYCYIKYYGEKKISNNSGKELKAYIITFNNMSKKLLESIRDDVEEKIVNDPTKTIDIAIKEIINLFSKAKFTNDFKDQLIGDIGELVFMIKSKKMGLNSDQYIRQSEHNLYDFVFNKKFVEVKSSSKNLNEIVINYRQIKESEDKLFIVSKFQILENKMNIIDLYKELNSNNPIVKEKENRYVLLSNDEPFLNILNDYTIDLNKAECFILDSEVVPKINIEHEGGLKNLKCHIGITNCKKYQLEELKKMLGL